jgi:hypothetical protein
MHAHVDFWYMAPTLASPPSVPSLLWPRLQVHIDDFCNRQLAPYLKAFPKGGEASSLEKIERRFAWCRRALKNVEER